MGIGRRRVTSSGLRSAIALGLCVATAGIGATQSAVTLQQVSIRRVSPTGVVFFQRNRNAFRPPTLRVLPDGRMEVRSASLVELVTLAYGFEVDVDMFAGGWTWTDRFDISATTDPALRVQQDGVAVPPELRPLLQRLLEDRFALKLKLDTRQLFVYSLRRASGNTAPALRPSGSGCLGPCTMSGVTMAGLASFLRRYVDRTVVDDTGLTGTYDIAFTVRGVAEGLEEARMLVHDNLQSQLGLALEPAQQPKQVLVIARARRP